MDHNYRYDICIIGPGRIGLPWAAALARQDFSVLCVDIDEEHVEAINSAEPPFHEPGMKEYLEYGVENGNIEATSHTERVQEAKVVGITLNAPEDDLQGYLEILGGYAEKLGKDQVIINRTTLPVEYIDRSKQTVADGVGVEKDELKYVTFPERLAEGFAIEEIENLPKIMGTASEEGEAAVNWLTSNFDGEKRFANDETAMFVKLIDNTYRDAKFSIANQFALLAEEIDEVDSHEAIEMANHDYPRNDIPTPGTVGGKCLSKDPHFLMKKTITKQPWGSDLFRHTRKTNAEFERKVFWKVMEQNPDSAGILGTGFKRDNGDEFESPAIRIKEKLEEVDVDTLCFDPHSEKRDTNMEKVLKETDVLLLAVNHTYFEKREEEIKDKTDSPIIDVWGIFEKDENTIRVGG